MLVTPVAPYAATRAFLAGSEREMAVIRRGKAFLIRIYQGREPGVGKRLSYNETFKGTHGEAKKREAVLKAEKYTKKLTNTSRIKLVDYCAHYFRERRHRHRENTRYELNRMLGRYILRYIGHMQIGKITTELLQAHFNFLLDSKRKAGDSKRSGAPTQLGKLCVRTVANVKRALRSVLALAVDEKLISENPVSKVKLPELNKPRVNVFSFVEVLAFISVKNLFWYGNAFVFALHTGLRPEELMALIWSDIDFQNNTVRIERACAWVNNVFKGFQGLKTNRSYRFIKLDPDQLALLREQQEKLWWHAQKRRAIGRPYGEPTVLEWVRNERRGQSSHYANTELVFPARDGRVPNRQSASESFKSMLKRAGLSRDRLLFRWYDLRHTHATYLITMGMPSNIVAQRLGHSVAELMKTYIHVIPDLEESASAVFASFIPIKLTPHSRAGAERRLRSLAKTIKNPTQRALLEGLIEGEPSDKLEPSAKHTSGTQTGAQAAEDEDFENLSPS